ncbi:MAG: DUF1385 domain-containing protein [Acutalibacteraceae bacterium]|nr:DUF1385 domain-containing protein [Acutalibacteraceae bacterium]
MSCKKTSIGGQALIEGIMMRGPKRTVMAVRKKDGSIDVSEREAKSLKDKCFLFKWPIFRGVVGFIESLTVGYKAMMDSAEISGYLDEIEEEEKKETTPQQDEKKSPLMTVIMIIATVLGVLLSVALFIYLPSLVFKGVNFLAGGILASWQALFEGILKILIFLGYMIAVSYMKDIRRVFEYHGAEHKTIFCYEAQLPLTVENVRKQSRFHPRCGTSFMILMLLVSIFVTFILDAILPWLKGILWLRTIIKLLLIPVICGIGYELIKVCGKHDNVITRIIAAPGLWIQRITVKEPDDSMIEIAIAAMNEVIPENEGEDKW